MFLIRQSKPKDVQTFLRMARMVYFINLPPNEQVISAKIQHSAKCFAHAAGVPEDVPVRKIRAKGSAASAGSGGAGGWAAAEHESEFFMFTMEELATGAVVGTSQVRCHQGGPGNPNWSMQVSEKTFRSDPLSFRSTHLVGKLFGDETGPSEIGGLILQPSHRGHSARPGRFLSFVRFHFMGLFRDRFADRVLAEMMAPVTSEGDNIFWDHFGRKFIPVKYAEADRFCQHNRKFIPELLPKEEIYLSLFPLEVQNMVAVVSKETLPARRLLESLGFTYRNFIDPFDGGPHLDAPTDAIPLVATTRRVGLGKPVSADKCDAHGIVSVLADDGEFRAIECDFAGSERSIRLTPESMELLSASVDTEAGVTPLNAEPTEQIPAVKTAKKPRVMAPNPARGSSARSPKAKRSKV